MPRLTQSQIQPPSNWQDFEELCHDLWTKIWKDPETCRNGRSGQSQHGVDIYGRPDNGKDYAGIQCKGKENWANVNLTKKEFLAEIEKAKTFKPSLLKFIVATSGKRDARLQKVAREITEKHRADNLFSVRIVFVYLPE